jgi:hypothetical protein
VAQLQTLRTLARTGPLEEARRAGQVLQQWVQLNPNTVGPARDLLNNIMVKDTQKYDPILNDGAFTLGSIRMAYEGGRGLNFRSSILGKYYSALNELNGGYTDNVVAALKALKQVVSDLPNNYGDFLYFSQNGKRGRSQGGVAGIRRL